MPLCFVAFFLRRLHVIIHYAPIRKRYRSLGIDIEYHTVHRKFIIGDPYNVAIRRAYGDRFIYNLLDAYLPCYPLLGAVYLFSFRVISRDARLPSSAHTPAR